MVKKPVFIILGATGGIGSETCRILRQRGTEVVLAARDRGRLEALSRELGGAYFESVDATDLDAVSSLVKNTVDRFGTVDGLANCVGSILLKAAHQTSVDEWRHTLSTNLDTAFATVKAGARAMRKGGGSIVLMASAAAQVGLPSHEAIAAAKAGVVGLGRSAAATYASKNIRVNVVAPGLVDTPMSAGITANPLMLKASAAMHPLGRIGRPEEVANVIAWLLSDESAWVTGQVIGVDGGLGTIRSKATA